MDINTCMHIYKYIYRRTRGHLHFHMYIHCMQSIYTYLYKQKRHIILYTLYKQIQTCIQDIWPNFDLIFDQVRFPWNKGNSRNLSYLLGAQVVWGCNTYDYTDIPPTSMAMENWNHEWVDVSPIKNGDVPAGHVSFQGSIWDKNLHLTIQKVPFRLQLPIAHLENMMLKDLEILNL